MSFEPIFEYRDSSGYPLTVGQAFPAGTRQAGATFMGVNRFIADRKLAQYAWRSISGGVETDWASATRINTDVYRIIVDTRPRAGSKSRVASQKAFGLAATDAGNPIANAQEFIFKVASSLDPSRNWNQPSNVTGAIDSNTVGATQVILYKAEQVEPIPSNLVVLLQPAKPSLWVEVLKSNIDEFVEYARRTVGQSESRPLTNAGKIFIAGTIGLTALIIIGVKQLAKAEDRHGWLVKYS